MVLMYNVVIKLRRKTMKQNYQLILDKTLNCIKKEGVRPTLLLHACCAPCSSYVLEYLNEYFDITVFFYNPNITENAEYQKRADELIWLIQELPHQAEIKFIDSGYSPEKFIEISKGLENAPEGGERCFKCYRLRLEESARIAKKNGFDYFTTTLSISPHKNAQALNDIGKKLSDAYDVGYLFSDFKKRNGYKRSCELSEIYNLYRQDYCGCIYSKKERENNEH